MKIRWLILLGVLMLFSIKCVAPKVGLGNVSMRMRMGVDENRMRFCNLEGSNSYCLGIMFTTVDEYFRQEGINRATLSTTQIEFYEKLLRPDLATVIKGETLILRNTAGDVLNDFTIERSRDGYSILLKRRADCRNCSLFLKGEGIAPENAIRSEAGINLGTEYERETVGCLRGTLKIKIPGKNFEATIPGDSGPCAGLPCQ